MLFNSPEFLLFLPTVFILYWLVFFKDYKKQNILLLIASYFFYGWWSWKFMILLLGSTLLDYLYGFGVNSANPKKSKLFLWLGVVNNLGILFIFKYYNFFAAQFQISFAALGFDINPAILQVVLPVGISFYTFHGMSYVFDIYRQKQKPIQNFVDYAVFVSFFPLLVAGPIERAGHLLPQVTQKRTFSYVQAVEGGRLILWGLFKKVIIADHISVTSDIIFENYQIYNSATLVLGAIVFAFQIYCDFSGYSDIALGVAKLFGFELLSNFRFPYFSRNLAEFWRRWHVSLSSWFRDYLYIPLGGSKKGKLNTILNTFIIFLVSGFWHGASWNFIIWGAIHACGFLPILLLSNNRAYTSDIVAETTRFPSMKEIFQMLTTFIFVTFAWIFFRSESLHQALGYLKQMPLNYSISPKEFLNVPLSEISILLIILLCFIDWFLRHNERKLKVAPYRIINYLIYAIMLSMTLAQILSVDASKKSFIYFQF